MTDRTYAQTKKLFVKSERDSTTGFYCKDIVSALQKAKKQYTFKQYVSDKKLLVTEGTIVFIKPNVKYPFGHFLARTKNGWMNP